MNQTPRKKREPKPCVHRWVNVYEEWRLPSPMPETGDVGRARWFLMRCLLCDATGWVEANH